MRYIEGVQRNQTTMFPDTLDSYITEDNVVRFIDVFVDSLDLKAMKFTYSETKDTGRKPYNPGDMLKLFIYGYLNSIKSTRDLEKESLRNVELMWLMNRLSPDFKTIADFRADNLKSIKKACREFVMLCKRLGMYGGDIVAIDGSKFRAVNNNDRNYSKNRLHKMLESIDKDIESYLKDIERTDRAEVKIKKINGEELTEIIKGLEESKKEIRQLLQEIEDGGNEQISLTDPDSRMMLTREGNQVSYNVQFAVDSCHHLIVDHEVINDRNDLNSLSMMANKAKETLEVEELKVVCDKGYFNKKEIIECHNNNIECYIPQPIKSSNENKGRFRLEEFTYDTANDKYICPAGEDLNYKNNKVIRDGLALRRYRGISCRTCKLKSNCTPSKAARYIDRWEHEEILEAMKDRMRTHKDMMIKRKSIIEHVFGTLKHWMGYKHFLMRGKEKVSCEISLAVLSYNMKRAINIIGVKALIAAL